MIVIEAVRTGCWNAITGQRQVESVQECVDELGRGDPGRPGYVRVTAQDIARMTIVPVSDVERAKFRLAYPTADGLDPGERDLVAQLASRADDFEVCCCDKAAVVAVHELGRLDRVVSLEAVATSVGARPTLGLKVQFTDARMRQWRMSLRLGGQI